MTNQNMSKITDKQHKANIANAKLGGVKTQAGKNIVRFNARKHGVLAQLRTPYEEKILEYFLSQLYEEKEPKNFIEEFLIERVALGYLRLYRVAKAEKEYMEYSLNQYENPSSLDFTDKEDRQEINYERVETLCNTFLRYETNIENKMYTALKELRLQQESSPKNGFVS